MKNINMNYYDTKDVVVFFDGSYKKNKKKEMKKLFSKIFSSPPGRPIPYGLEYKVDKLINEMWELKNPPRFKKDDIVYNRNHTSVIYYKILGLKEVYHNGNNHWYIYCAESDHCEKCFEISDRREVVVIEKNEKSEKNKKKK